MGDVIHVDFDRARRAEVRADLLLKLRKFLPEIAANQLADVMCGDIWGIEDALGEDLLLTAQDVEARLNKVCGLTWSAIVRAVFKALEESARSR